MIKGFDLVVGIQICMMIVIFVLSIRYALAEERTLTSYSIMPASYSVWSGILLYYFSHFFFLASLWFLLGVFLTVGMVVFFWCSILYRFCQRNRKLEYYPRTSFLLFNLLIATIICWGIQGAAFLYPYIVDLWVCNEAFGIISGLMNGLLWGTMGICYLFSPRQNYKKYSVLS